MANEFGGLPEWMKTKSRDSFAKLYDTYAGPLYGFILRTVPDTKKSEELLQEVFIEVWKRIDQYEPSKERFFTWLYQLTRNVCMEYQQTRGNVKTNL